MVPHLGSARRALPLAFAAALAACKSVEVPKVPGVTPYRMVIQQGNYVSPDMVAQLKPGMTKEQVRYVLGTPLIKDIFHADRWDYAFYRETPDGKREQRNLSVIFEDGKLARVIGDLLPPEGATAAGPAGVKPAAEAKPAPGAAAATEAKPAAAPANPAQPAAPAEAKGTVQNWRAASDIQAEREGAEAAGKSTVSADEAAKAQGSKPAEGKSEESKSEEGKSEEASKDRGFFGRLLDKIGL